jgi:hypothetical protein
MRYVVVKIQGKYALERSFFGLFKEYKDLSEALFWWSPTASYFRDCLTDDSDLVFNLYARARRLDREVVLS